MRIKSNSLMVKKHPRKLKAIELFAGAGGMALGLSQAGIDVVGLVEIDKFCLATLAANRNKAFPRARIIRADISKVTGKEILESARVQGELDLLTGGPPCQGFTWSNRKRSINDPRSQMMWHMIRLVGEMKPRCFIIENVPGLLSFKDFFIELLSALEQKGYELRFNLMDAASYGVPQRRLRVFIEGCRSDMKIVPRFPAPTHFDLDNDKAVPPASLVAIKCFADHGFSKEQVRHTWFNRKLAILMDKRTAARRVEQAVRQLLLEGVFNATRKPRRKLEHQKEA